MDLDFPTISMPEATPVAAPAAPAPAVSDALPAVLSIKDAALAQFSATEATLLALAARHKDVVYDVTVPRQMTAAKLARQEIRDHRFTVQRVEKSTLAELNDLKRDVKAEAERLIAIIEPIEAGVHGQIKAHEERIEAEKAERARVEAERCAVHERNIVAIRTYFDRCTGLSAERIATGIELLNAQEINEAAWQDYAERAVLAKAETLSAMRSLHTTTLASEQEAARIEAQRVEQARVAAEQAERQRALDAERAELERWQNALDAQREESERLERRAEANRAAVLAAEAQIAAAPIVLAVEPQPLVERTVVIADARLTMSGGTISNRLGFIASAELLARLTGTKAWYEDEFTAICDALIEHITTVRNNYTTTKEI